MDLVSDSEWLYRQDLTKRFIKVNCGSKDKKSGTCLQVPLTQPNPTNLNQTRKSSGQLARII